VRVCIKYSMCDVIREVVTCVWSFDIRCKINVYDNNHDWTPEKKRKKSNQRNVLHKSPCNRWFKNGIHSLL